MVEKIVEGKVQKFFKEACLVNQVFIKDNKTTVDKVIAATAKTAGVESVRVAAFHRLQLGQ
jgi:elongation factor Ts